MRLLNGYAVRNREKTLFRFLQRPAKPYFPQLYDQLATSWCIWWLILSVLIIETCSKSNRTNRIHIVVAVCAYEFSLLPETCTNTLTFCLLWAINVNFKHLCRIFYDVQHIIYQIQLTCTTLYHNEAICKGKLAKFPYFVQSANLAKLPSHSRVYRTRVFVRARVR